MRRDELVDELGRLERSRAEDHALHAAIECGLHRLGAAQSAAGLHGHAERGDALEVRGVRLRAVLGAVEVDHVQPGGAAVHPALRGVEWIGVVGGLGGEVALEESHGAAAANVDGWVELHVSVVGRRSARVGADREEVLQEAEPVAGALLRVALRAHHVAAGDDRRERAAVVPLGDDHAGVDGISDERVHVVERQRSGSRP